MKENKTLAIVGCDTNSQTIDSLRSLGFSVLTLPKHPSLPLPVNSHADMLMFELNGCVFAEKKYIEIAKASFDTMASYGYNVLPCDISLGNKYPEDIAFNVAVCNRTLYGNTKHNAAEIMNFAQSNSFKITSVKQGYTKCSTVVLPDKAIITADEGIASAAEANGISVLKISNSPESVTLNGYNYGFLGGACGVFEKNVYFAGNIELHPNGESIKSFCEKFGFNTINLSDSALVDIGGIIFLPLYS